MARPGKFKFTHTPQTVTFSPGKNMVVPRALAVNSQMPAKVATPLSVLPQRHLGASLLTKCASGTRTNYRTGSGEEGGAGSELTWLR